MARIQEAAPTREAADALYRTMVATARRGDANDRLYQLEASMDYDPGPLLEEITAPVLAINFADDELNPPQLGVLERVAPSLRNGRSVLLPAGPRSRGHQSAQQAAEWAPHLAAFLSGHV